MAAHHIQYFVLIETKQKDNRGAFSCSVNTALANIFFTVKHQRRDGGRHSAALQCICSKLVSLFIKTSAIGDIYWLRVGDCVLI